MDASAIFRQLLSLAGTRYPLRMLCGLAGGIVLSGILDVSAASMPESKWLQALAGLHAFWAAALGVFVATGSILVSGQRLTEEMMRKLDLIEQIIQRGNLTQNEQRQAWRNVLQKAVDKFSPSDERGLDPDQVTRGAVEDARSEESELR